MPGEREQSTTNWDLLFFKKYGDVEEAAEKFEKNIPEEYKEMFEAKPEKTKFFIVLLSTLSGKERKHLEEDFKMGKVRSEVMTAHNLGSCLMLYKIFSGESDLERKESSSDPL